MSTGKERKYSLLNRLVRLTVKPPPIKEEVRSESSLPKFVYQLPQSFFEAVDNARIEAGYDVLPRFHQSNGSHRQIKHQHTRSPVKKVRFNLEPQKPLHYHKTITQSSLLNLPRKRTLSTTTSIQSNDASRNFHRKEFVQIL
ncbi:unnamed protein product [Rotaria sp. Silwood1]|nr:unnamed protein product [Rotaria sp. Silwood1]CAF3733356.1 unnamed protein product [Rotaria sp. Silwood1]CAF4881791.1 unnamed protein product [Rotaria sp. Silwood1]